MVKQIHLCKLEQWEARSFLLHYQMTRGIILLGKQCHLFKRCLIILTELWWTRQSSLLFETITLSSSVCRTLLSVIRACHCRLCSISTVFVTLLANIMFWNSCCTWGILPLSKINTEYSHKNSSASQQLCCCRSGCMAFVKALATKQGMPSWRTVPVSNKIIIDRKA